MNLKDIALGYATYKFFFSKDEEKNRDLNINNLDTKDS